MAIDMTNANEGVSDLYDSERKAIIGIRAQMMSKYSFKAIDSFKAEDDMKNKISQEIRQRCAEIGFVVEVEWEWEKFDEKTGELVDFSPTVSSNPNDRAMYWVPNVVATGRTDKTVTEFDHDRQKHEIRSGLLDGKVGVINPNTGQITEPKKKNIY
jgi:hypothetical protein